MQGSWYELGIIVFIVVGLGYTAWKGGASNPVPTGRLQTEVRKLQGDVKGFGGKLSALEQNSCTRGDLALLQQALEAEQERATRVEQQLELVSTEVTEIRVTVSAKHQVIDGLAESVRTLSGRQETMAAQLASTDATVRAIEKSVDRIYDVVVPKGMKG